MEYIELVIKIPESEIPKQQDVIEIPLHFIDGKVCEAGGYEFDVLPKGHGDLIDADKAVREENSKMIDFETTNTRDRSYCRYARVILNNAPTIIEADKENKI